MVEQSRQWDTVSDQISVEEAADLSGYHPDYMRKLVRQGKILAKRKGPMYWIDRDSLRTYLEEIEQLGAQRFNWRRSGD